MITGYSTRSLEAEEEFGLMELQRGRWADEADEVEFLA